MRTAPAVSVGCSGGWPWRLLQSVLPALACASVLAWVLSQLQRAEVLALWALPVVGLGAWWLAAPRMRLLRWDGQAWSVDGETGQLRLMIDAGAGLLLHFQPAGPGRGRWLAVSAGEAGAAWHALRAAVYSRPSEATPRVRPPERTAD